MYINDDGIVVMRQVGAHSDGDSMVHFRRADVIATGDILDLRHFPVIDPAKGGSIQGELAALNYLLEITIPAMPLVLKPGRTLLVPGHGYISDYSMQTRLFHFDGTPSAGANTWQGVSTAEWTLAGTSAHGSMKSVTTQLQPGYLRKNGVPYSARTVFTEYWDVHVQDNGDRYLVVTNKVEDPAYLQQPWLTAIHFKKEDDPGKWDPTSCDARF